MTIFCLVSIGTILVPLQYPLASFKKIIEENCLTVQFCTVHVEQRRASNHVSLWLLFAKPINATNQWVLQNSTPPFKFPSGGHGLPL